MRACVRVCVRACVPVLPVFVRHMHLREFTTVIILLSFLLVSQGWLRCRNRRPLQVNCVLAS